MFSALSNYLTFLPRIEEEKHNITALQSALTILVIPISLEESPLARTNHYLIAVASGILAHFSRIDRRKVNSDEIIRRVISDDITTRRGSAELQLMKLFEFVSQAGHHLRAVTMKFIALALFGFLYIANTEKMGPFIAEIQSFSPCPAAQSGKNMAIFSSKQQRLSRKKFMLLLDVALAMDFKDEITAKAVVSKKTAQGWKENYFRIDLGGLCAAMKTFIPEIMEDVMSHLKLKRRNCPIPAGNYSEIPIRPIVDVKTLPAFFYSTFKVRFHGYNRSEVVGCFDVIAETKPK